MVLCLHCARESSEAIDPRSGSVSCGVCGKVCYYAAVIDGDVNRYINTKEEYSFKKIIWEAMNKDYKKSRDKRQQRKKRANNVNAAAGSTRVETKKRQSSKINYDVLDKLFDDEDPGVVTNGKRTWVESRSASDVHKYEEDAENDEDPDFVPNRKRTQVESQNASDDDKYDADTENSNDEEGEQEKGDVEQDKGDVEEATNEEEEEDTEEWYSRNEEEEGDYGYDDREVYEYW